MSLSVGEFRDAQGLKAFNLGGLETSAWDYGMEGSRDRNAHGTSEGTCHQIMVANIISQ
jgi:hypothetical protein